MTVSVLVQQSQDIRCRPRLTAAQIVKREEKLEAIADSSGGLECEILLSYLKNGVREFLKAWRILTTCVEVVPASGGAMFKAKASMPLLAASLISDSQLETVYAPLLPT